MKIFTRKIIREPLDGSTCKGETSKTEVCNVFDCPLPSCHWSDWSGGACSKSCGGDGVRIFRRRLLNDSVVGSTCGGETVKLQVCHKDSCPQTAHSQYYVAIIVLLVLILLFSVGVFLHKKKIVTFPYLCRKQTPPTVELFTFDGSDPYFKS